MQVRLMQFPRGPGRFIYKLDATLSVNFEVEPEVGNVYHLSAEMEGILRDQAKKSEQWDKDLGVNAFEVVRKVFKSYRSEEFILECNLINHSYG